MRVEGGQESLRLQKAAEGDAREADVDETLLINRLVLKIESPVEGREHTCSEPECWQQAAVCLHWLLRMSSTPMARACYVSLHSFLVFHR